MANTLLSNIVAPSAIVTLTGSQTLTNKTLTSPTLTSPTITGTLTVGSTPSVGTNGAVLTSTGSGLQWVTPTSNTLDGLTDVVISSASTDQVLKYNGTIWVNADADTIVASAVFAPDANSDLGSVTDLIIGLSEDLGSVATLASLVYNLGPLQLDGVVSLNNIDQSVKADYIGYAIVFGF